MIAIRIAQKHSCLQGPCVGAEDEKEARSRCTAANRPGHLEITNVAEVTWSLGICRSSAGVHEALGLYSNSLQARGGWMY